MDQIASGLIMQELERGDSALRSFASVQSSLVMFPIFTYGSEAQKRSGFPGSPAAKRSAVSGSPSPTRGAIRAP